MANDSTRILSNPAFRFLVSVGGKSQAAFTDCSLPAVDWETEEIREGGLNVYIHQLPGRRKTSKVTLKNGVGKSEIVTWFIECMSEKFVRKPVAITLLNVSHQPVITWNLDAALPIRWAGPELKTDSNAIAIQTLEFACGEITVELK